MTESKAMEVTTTMGRTIMRGNPLFSSVVVFATVIVLFVVSLVVAAVV